MVKVVPDILAKIVEHKKRDLREHQPDLERRAELAINDRRDFDSALRSRSIAIIAEIKKASPSRGILAANFNPIAIAKSYENAEAAALSVLTEEHFFQGSLDHLQQAHGATTIPVLRKDFTIDDYHVIEAAAHGADAILLIAALLDAPQLRRFRERAQQYRMAAIVEVHDPYELEQGLDSGANIIGVNSRDLRTFQVDINVSLRLAEKIPDSVIKIAESGIHSQADIQKLRSAGYRGFLIGEHLMRSPDPEGALRALLA